MKIIVPATTSNIASGFDVLGIALDIFLEVEFNTDSNKFNIEGCPQIYCNEENLVVKGIKRIFDLYDDNLWVKNKDKISINIKSEIPIARGLGSSAACVAAGMIFANEFLYSNYGNKKLSTNRLIEIGVECEGHPDNISAALLGGMTASCIDTEDKRIYSEKILVDYSFFDKFTFYLLIPDFEVKTETARKILPKNVEFKDAIFNLSRLALLFTSLINNDYNLFKFAFEDRLHQVYRKNLIADYDEIIANAKESGALATFISGSGSTVIAITKNYSSDFYKTNFEENMQRFFNLIKEKKKITWLLKRVNINKDGAVLVL